MNTRSKWLWGLTLANIAVASMLVLVIYSIMLALAALAAAISEWPLYTLLLVGIALSIAGLTFTRGAGSRAQRIVAAIINSSALAIDLLVVFGLAMIFFSSVRERFIIPQGYKGDVYVVYGARDGEPLEKTRSEVTYRIPRGGILVTREPMVREWTRTEYYYERRDGSLERIRNFWPSTIHPTPENLANNQEFGVFFPRSGTWSDAAGCSIEFEQFYVGTKAHLLSEYRESDLDLYLHEHPGACAK